MTRPQPAHYTRQAHATGSIPPSSVNPDPEERAWLDVVEEKVRQLRFGVVQIVVHDSVVVQVEQTERTRFDISRGTNTRRARPAASPE